MTKAYNRNELLTILVNYYNKYGKSPTKRDLLKFKYPCASTYIKYFGSWNNALIAAGLDVNVHTELFNKPNICELCGSIHSQYWRWQNNLKVCNKCYKRNRNYFYGISKPTSNTGISIITEHVVYIVLNDCIKCNTKDNFNATYDLISEKYGTINVKSCTLNKQNRWNFGKRVNSKIPNYYICLGFDESKTEILQVFIIPGICNIVHEHGIWITNSNKCLFKIKQYIVDSEPYNKIYKELDINILPEFLNYVPEIIT